MCASFWTIFFVLAFLLWICDDTGLKSIELLMIHVWNLFVSLWSILLPCDWQLILYKSRLAVYENPWAYESSMKLFISASVKNFDWNFWMNFGRSIVNYRCILDEFLRMMLILLWNLSVYLWFFLLPRDCLKNLFKSRFTVYEHPWACTNNDETTVKQVYLRWIFNETFPFLLM